MHSPAEPIRGKVADVLTTREVAINRGTRDGVDVGMIFRILSTTGTEITDPDTEEVLGSVELTKVKVKVTIVQERMAVASTYKRRRINEGGKGIGIDYRLFEPPKWVTRTETLHTDEATREELAEHDAFVSRGDPVVQDIED